MIPAARESFVKGKWPTAVRRLLQFVGRIVNDIVVLDQAGELPWSCSGTSQSSRLDTEGHTSIGQRYRSGLTTEALTKLLCRPTPTG